MIKSNFKTWSTLLILGLISFGGVFYTILLDQRDKNEQPFRSWRLDQGWLPLHSRDIHVHHDWIIRGTDVKGTYYCKDCKVTFRPSLKVTEMFGIYYRRLKKCENSRGLWLTNIIRIIFFSACLFVEFFLSQEITKPRGGTHTGKSSMRLKIFMRHYLFPSRFATKKAASQMAYLQTSNFLNSLPSLTNCNIPL